MKKALWLFFVALVPGCHPPGGGDQPSRLTVFAAASTFEAVTEIADRFTGETGTTVRLSFAASSLLAKQINSGADAGVYISANSAWMDYVAKEDLIVSGTIRDLVANQLVWIVPAGAERTNFAPDFPNGWSGRFAMGDPAHVPAGIYGKQRLEALGWWPMLAPRLIPARDARDALRLAVIGEADLGLVYATDAAATEKVRVISVAGFTSPAIRYQVGLCRGAGSAARDFHSYLFTTESAETFRRYGFHTLKTPVL